MRRSDLPGNWIRSKTGVIAYVATTQEFNKVRLHFASGTMSSDTYTIRELNDMGVTWFRRAPRKGVDPLKP